MSVRLIIPNLDHLIERYQAGESEKRLSEEAGVARGVLRRRLRDAGIPVRGQSEAQRLHALSMSAEERSRNAKAAHDAIRGMQRSSTELEQRALTRERTRSQTTGDALRLADWIEGTGRPVVIEKAIGKYNVDLSVGNTVAVEVCGGTWHLDKRHRARSLDLFDAGWNLIFVWIVKPNPQDGYKGRPLQRRAAEDIIAFAQRSDSDPSFRRQYRMIWGGGEFISAGRADRDDWTLVGPFKRSMH